MFKLFIHTDNGFNRKKIVNFKRELSLMLFHVYHVKSHVDSSKVQIIYSNRVYSRIKTAE